MNIKFNKRTILEIAVAVIAIGIIAFYLSKHAPNIMNLIKSENVSQIDDYLESHGPEGKLLLVLLQVVETISIVLPATPVYLCSGILFGKVMGTLVCYLTNLILNVLIFLVARKMHGFREQTLKMDNQKYISELMQKATRMDRVVIVMCFLPIVPNGMIPYLSAKTNVTLAGFTKAIAIGSFLSIALYVCCGDILVSDSYKIVIPIIIVLVLLSILCFVFRKKLTKVGKKLLKEFLGIKEN